MPTPARIVHIEATRCFPVSLHAGFEFITDPERWPDYWPRFVRHDNSLRWRQPGDRARVTLRMLGRDVELDMTLVRFEPPQVVEYTSEQRGLPPARHWRRFGETDGQLDYQIVVEYSPRPGWRGVLDRTLVRRAIARSVDDTMDNLGELFA